MIYLDFSNLTTACYFAQENEYGEGKVDTDDFRKHIVHSLMQISNKFKHKYGKLLLCCDGKRCWRYEVFPHYKVLRQLQRANDGWKWQQIGELTRLMQTEISEAGLFRAISVPRAEGDDVIAVLSREIVQPSLIISNDKDYHQLHVHPHVSQYSRQRDVVYRRDDPQADLKEKVLKGDRNDSIPNIRSKDDHFVLREARQSPVSAKMVKEFSENFFVGEGGIPEEYRHAFQRNQKLVDFKFIPQDIQDAIFAEYNKPEIRDLMSLGKRTAYLAQAGINPNSF